MMESCCNQAVVKALRHFLDNIAADAGFNRQVLEMARQKYGSDSDQKSRSSLAACQEKYASDLREFIQRVETGDVEAAIQTYYAAPEHSNRQRSNEYYLTR